MDKKYSNIYEQYCFEQETKSNYLKVKKRVKNKKNHFKKIVIFLFCMIVLFMILMYSFNIYIKDIFPSKTLKYLEINYKKLMYPVQSMLPSDNLISGGYILKNIEYDNPKMINIPEHKQKYELRNALISLCDNYKRIYPAVYIFEYEGKNYVDINANEPFPAASIIKLPILIEMFIDIEQEKFMLEDKMVLEDYYRAEGSGNLKYSQGGIEHTLDYLAKTMIENSDNSSTNMIISKIGGMPKINNALRSWGLSVTRVNNWLPDLKGTNTITAREIGKILYNIDITDIISNSSKQKIASYMMNVKNTRLLKAGLPQDAIILHKTGDIGFMLGDAGIVKTPGGKKYIVVILIKRPYNHLQGKDFIVKASTLIYNNIAL